MRQPLKRHTRTLAALAASALAMSTLAVIGEAIPAQAAGIVTHPTRGCNGAVVSTPAAGKELTAQSLGLPGSVEAFYAEAARRRVTWLTTMDCTTEPRSHALVPAGQQGAEPAVTNAGFVSANWSGYQINQTAQYNQAGWTVPTVSKPKLPNPPYSTTGYDSSTWAGIGGGFNSGGGALIQAGTSQDVNAAGSASYYFWYEIVGGTGDTGSEKRISLAAHPGDVVGDVAIWTPTGGAEMGDCDFTVGGCVQFSLPSSAPGTSIEWIVEAPSSGGIIQPLAPFGSVSFVNDCWTKTYVTGATCSTITGAAPISLQSHLFGASQTLAAPGPINSAGNGFTVNYFPPERCPTC